MRLRFSAGEVALLSAVPVTLAEPRTTARRVGRFAAELWRGGDLVERVRFDFPLLGAADESQDIEAGLRAEAEILLPALERPTTLRILDRRTRRELLFDWPLPAGDRPPLRAEEGGARSDVSEGPSVEPAR